MAESSAGQRTEKATFKRRQTEREEGHVARGPDLVSALVLIATLFLFRLAVAHSWNALTALWQTDLGGLSGANWTRASAIAQMRSGLWQMARICAPWLFVPMLAGMAAYFAQVGFVFTPKTLVPRLDRLNPARGLRHMFGLQGFGQGAGSLLKLSAASAVVYFSVKGMSTRIASLSFQNVTGDAGAIGRVLFTVLVRIVIALLVLGGFDYLYQRAVFERNIKMTKQEVKEEYKQAEGDPLIRQQIRRRGRQIAQRRMMQRVKKADFVVANPTHVSIAVVYELGAPAPIVVAKGQDELALRIRETAKTHAVPVIENRPLAWDLYHTCDIDEPVPARLFSVVAQLLAEVYRSKGKQVRS